MFKSPSGKIPPQKLRSSIIRPCGKHCRSPKQRFQCQIIFPERFCINRCYYGVDRQVFNHEGCPDRMYMHESMTCPDRSYMHECMTTLVIENLLLQSTIEHTFTYGPQCKPLQFPINTYFETSPCKSHHFSGREARQPST